MRKTRFTIFFAVIFLALFGVAGVASAAEYYVSPIGSAEWTNCSGLTPFNGIFACSWQTAMTNAVAGDVVYFRGGVYEPGPITWNSYGNSPVMRPMHNGTAENPITFKGYPGEAAIIHDGVGTGMAPNNNTVAAVGCFQNSYITWDGLAFDRVNNNGYQASSIVRFELSDHCLIINSELIGRPQLDQYNGTLIAIVQSQYIYIGNNKLHGMSCGITPYSSCVNATAIWSFNYDHVYIYNNDVYDNNNGLSTKVGTSYLYIYNNHLWNNPRAAINYSPGIDGTMETHIYQNIIRNSGAALYAPDPPRINYNLRFYNNSVYNSSSSAGALIDNGTYTNTRDAEVFNNIFSFGGTNSLWARYGAGVNKPAYSDYNDFFGSGRWNLDYQTDYNTIASWRTTTGFDLNSLTTDPLFINFGGTNPADYKLQLNSPARIGRGGSYSSVMGAYITGNETIGYVAPTQADTTPPAAPTNLTVE